MTISFSTHKNGNPTHFPAKIWKSLFAQHHEAYWECYAGRLQSEGLSYHLAPESLLPKKHTIRTDTPDRWRAGNDIHFVIYNRTARRFQFAPVLKCVSVQQIEILWASDRWEGQDDTCGIFIDRQKFASLSWINGELYYPEQEYMDRVTILAQNDGFETHTEFLQFFNRDFSGKIIHWTDLRY